MTASATSSRAPAGDRAAGRRSSGGRREGLIGGIDIGATKIAVSLVDLDHSIVERSRFPTPEEGAERVVERIVSAVNKLSEPPVGIGVGAPGLVRDGVVMIAPNLMGWEEPVPLASMLAAELGLPLAVGNNANAFTVGEWLAGAGRGASNMLGVLIGTGIGGGLVIDGRPFTGAYGGAGEFGHVTVRINGALCSCGRRGCVEAYAGRGSMELAVEVASAGGPSSALDRIRRQRRKKQLTSGVWAEALRDGDRLAAEIIDQAIWALGVAVGSAINVLDLDRVIIGGGLAQRLGQDLADRIADAAAPHMLDRTARRGIVLAALGDDAAAIGAAELFRAATALRG